MMSMFVRKNHRMKICDKIAAIYLYRLKQHFHWANALGGKCRT